MENKENVTIIDIDNALFDIEVLAERVQVMVNDVDQDYFNLDIENTGKMWKIAPPFYTTAGIKTSIANDIVFDLLNKIRELREVLDSVSKGGMQI
jgi:glutamine synthetase type III